MTKVPTTRAGRQPRRPRDVARRLLVWIVIPGVVHAVVILLLMQLQFLVAAKAKRQAVIDTALEEIDIRDNPVEHLAPTNVKTSALANKKLDWAEMLKPDNTKVDKPDERTLEKMMDAEQDEPLKLARIAVPMNGLSSIPKTGATQEGKASVAAVVDALSGELAKLLTKRNILLVWLFDESRSTRRSQKEVRARITKLYAELQGDAPAGAQPKLVSSVVGFSDKSHPLLRTPTADPKQVQQAIDRVMIANVATENTMAACRDVIQRYHQVAKLQRRALVIFVVTDERGDDNDHLEDVVALAKQSKTRVFVLGGESRFQQQKSFPRHLSPKAPRAVLNSPPGDPSRRKWTVPATALTGRESAYPETLYAYLPESPWNGIPKYQGGFGYWALCRLAKATGGVYYILFGEKGPSYDPEVMAPYAPELCSRQEYIRRCKADPVRATIHRFHQELGEVPFHFASTRSAIPEKLLPLSEKYPFYGNLRPDHLGKDLGIAKDLAERRMRMLNKTIQILERGSLANHPHSPQRWEANRRLALADAYALRWSCRQYLFALADFRRKPRLSARARYYRVGSTGLYSSKKNPILGGPKAMETLKDVYAKYEEVQAKRAGTPWADKARRWRRVSFYRIVPVFPPRPSHGTYTPAPPPPPI